MTSPPRPVERRADIRTEASFVGWSCVLLAALSWCFLARLLFEGGRPALLTDAWAVVWLALAVAATAGAAAAYAVSAVGRLLAAEPER